VCFSGRLTAVKRADIFLESARLLIESGAENMHFYILGEGPELDGCREFIQKHSLFVRIHLLGFQLDPYPVLATMDVLIICSDHEGLPIILLESMVLGLVIVARAVGGIPEALADGEFGILVNSDQPEQFAQAITNIFENDAMATVLADKSALRAASEYDSRIMADNYARLYSEIAA
jgi:glycosyltransferase involved in cell wall biosynthesis